MHPVEHSWGNGRRRSGNSGVQDRRQRPDQGVLWSWRDLNPRLPRCERCGQDSPTRGNGMYSRVCGACVERESRLDTSGVVTNGLLGAEL
jgi:hypothetical protein